ncbi:MAG: cytochrome b N-terminal domain-containing protein [bacterium]
MRYTGPPRHDKGGYVSFRKSVSRFIDILDSYSSQFFGAGNNPFALTGALVLGFFLISVITGFLLLFGYVPSPDYISVSMKAPHDELAYSVVIRGLHRASADLIVITILFHMLRMWATGRYRRPNGRAWAIGLVALPLISIIGWSGYILGWDERAMVLLSWGSQLVYSADRWPVIGLLKPGSILGWFAFSPSNETDQILRIFSIHIGGAILIFFLVLWHLRRIKPSVYRLPILVWPVILILLGLVGAMFPIEHEVFTPFNPFAPPSNVEIDWIINFPLVFYPIIAPSVLSVIIVLVWIGLALLPKLEPVKPLVACVRESNCTGCRLCYQDCPYDSIEMVPHPDLKKRKQGREIARVINRHCSACGICVGACDFDAIELPALPSLEITKKIDSAFLISENPEVKKEVG